MGKNIGVWGLCGLGGGLPLTACAAAPTGLIADFFELGSTVLRSNAVSHEYLTGPAAC